MDSSTLMPIITGIVFIGVFIYAIIVGMNNNAAHRMRVERNRRIREALMPIDYICDGRSLEIPRPPHWDEDLHITLVFYPKMRQVFHITAPGHKTITRYNDIGGISLTSPQIQIPQGFNTPTAVPPRPVNPITAAHLREEIMPYLAAELNLSQEDINSTTVRLKGHEIRYIIEFNHIPVGDTPLVDYRPNLIA